jgi:hypothetical protein
LAARAPIVSERSKSVFRSDTLFHVVYVLVFFCISERLARWLMIALEIPGENARPQGTSRIRKCARLQPCFTFRFVPSLQTLLEAASSGTYSTSYSDSNDGLFFNKEAACAVPFVFNSALLPQTARLFHGLLARRGY